MVVVHKQPHVDIDVKQIPAGGLFMCHNEQYYIKYCAVTPYDASYGFNVNTGCLSVIAMTHECYSVKYFPNAKIVVEP